MDAIDNPPNNVYLKFCGVNYRELARAWEYIIRKEKSQKVQIIIEPKIPTHYHMRTLLKMLPEHDDISVYRLGEESYPHHFMIYRDPSKEEIFFEKQHLFGEVAGGWVLTTNLTYEPKGLYRMREYLLKKIGREPTKPTDYHIEALEKQFSTLLQESTEIDRKNIIKSIGKENFVYFDSEAGWIPAPPEEIKSLENSLARANA